MKSKLALLALLVSALATSIPVAAQGCSLCRDATAGSTLQARKALRLAIPFLGIPAIGIFAGSLVLARRFKPGRGE